MGMRGMVFSGHSGLPVYGTLMMSELCNRKYRYLSVWLNSGGDEWDERMGIGGWLFPVIPVCRRQYRKCVTFFQAAEESNQRRQNAVLASCLHSALTHS